MQNTTQPEMPADTDPGAITFNIISAVCWSMVTPTAIVTNTFTLLVIHRTANHADEVNHIFIVAINLILLLICLCFALPSTISSIAGGRWILGTFLCSAQSLVMVYLHCVSAFLMLSYSLERFVFLQYPLRYPRLITVERAKRLVACILILALVNIPLSGVLSDWKGVYIPSCHVCAPYSDPVLNKALFLSFFILLSVVPSVVAYIVHTALLLTVRQHLRRIMAEIPRTSLNTNGQQTADDGAAITGQRLQVATFDRKIRVNKSQLILLTLISPLALGVYLILDLALFGFMIPRYLVLVGNLSIFSGPTLIGLKVMLNSRVFKQTAKQLFTCCYSVNSNE
ncbi:probable G-protein coupled receptor 19 [Patiria miniata]|uniref:G-protein coupled receptors family 1 profile domain-containing protein n=1 Tax=Patiria miniata TaxID=46514 RepID=A0A914BP97_PATMI|nr:probable G-protein coupled receptor 19 [Patiria miniata]